jgi:peptide/nickel transport system substrate-binding protein
MQRKLFLVLMLISIFVLSVAGVSAQDAATPIDLARIGLSGAIGNLDPTVQQNAPTYQPAVLIGGQLFRYDANRQPQPDLVDTWEVSDDGLTYTMTLRDGLVYSDGTPLTMDDVLFTWDRVHEAAAVNKTLIQNVVSLEATDDTTMVWTLSQPEANFLDWFAFQFFMVHPKAQIEADPDYFTHPVSAGPYVLTDWIPGSPTATLTENPNYVHGPMMIKQIEIVSVPDLTSRTLQLAQGDLDYVYDLAPSVRGVISDDVTTYPHAIAGVYHVVFNLSMPADSPLMNRDVREAISLAIDRQMISDRAFYGISGPATSFVYPGVPEQDNNLPNGGARDLDAAKALLATTPFADGFDMTLGVWGARPGWRDAALVIAENLKDLNINVTIESMEDAVATQQLSAGNFQAQFTGNASYPVVTFLGNLFKSGNFWANAARYSSPEMDALFAQLGTTVDPDERLAIFQQIQELAYQDLPFLPISERVVLSGTRLPREILDAVNPGEYLHVATVAEIAGE